MMHFILFLGLLFRCIGGEVVINETQFQYESWSRPSHGTLAHQLYLYQPQGRDDVHQGFADKSFNNVNRNYSGCLICASLQSFAADATCTRIQHAKRFVEAWEGFAGVRHFEI